MHGVGLPFAQSAFESFGFGSERFSVVEEQSRVPDPNFSTVKFPNPEEKGALVSPWPLFAFASKSSRNASCN